MKINRCFTCDKEIPKTKKTCSTRECVNGMFFICLVPQEGKVIKVDTRTHRIETKKGKYIITKR